MKETKKKKDKKERERGKQFRHLRLVGTLSMSRGCDCVMRGLYIVRTDEQDWNTCQERLSHRSRFNFKRAWCNSALVFNFKPSGCLFSAWRLTKKVMDFKLITRMPLCVLGTTVVTVIARALFVFQCQLSLKNNYLIFYFYLKSKPNFLKLKNIF